MNGLDRDIEPILSHASASIADGAASLGAAIDTKGHRFLVVVLQTATIAGLLTVTLQSSTTSGGTYAAASPAIGTTIPDTQDNKVITWVIDLYEATQLNRFVKVNIGSTGGASVVGCGVLLMGAKDTNEVDETNVLAPYRGVQAAP